MTDLLKELRKKVYTVSCPKTPPHNNKTPIIKNHTKKELINILSETFIKRSNNNNYHTLSTIPPVYITDPAQYSPLTVTATRKTIQYYLAPTRNINHIH